jgi:hypothetical protein
MTYIYIGQSKAAAERAKGRNFITHTRAAKRDRGMHPAVVVVFERERESAVVGATSCVALCTRKNEYNTMKCSSYGC